MMNHQPFCRARLACATAIVFAQVQSSLGQCCEVEESEKLTGQATNDGDKFGTSVSVDGTVFVAGAPFDDFVGTSGLEGAMHVFRLEGDEWSQEDTLTAFPAAILSERFGFSVAVRLNVAVAGAPTNTATFDQTGSAYVFRKPSSTWNPDSQLFPSDGGADDEFGYSVALSGNVLVVGARSHDLGPTTSNAGAAYVFRYNTSTSTWAQEQKLTAAAPDIGDSFGWSVAVDGNVIVVGVPLGNVSGLNDAGLIRIFRHNGTSWVGEQTIPNPQPALNAAFGSAVGVSGNKLIIGDPNASPSGKAHVYRFDSPRWVAEAILTGCDTVNAGKFGQAVSISGSCAVVGAQDTDPAGPSQVGAAYSFRYDTPSLSWIQLCKLEASDTGNVDCFGDAVSVRNGIAVVGAPADNASAVNQGAAYSFLGFAPCECLSELNGDGQINGADLGILLLNWGPCSCPSDLTGDGMVDGADLGILLLSWGRCGGSPPPAPIAPGRGRDGEPGPLGPETEATVLDLALLLGWSDESSFYQWISTAPPEDIHDAGQFILDLYP